MRPTSAPFRCPRTAWVSSTSGRVCTTSTCAWPRSSTATATTPSRARPSRDVGPLLHPAGVALGPLVLAVLEPNEVEQPLDPPLLVAGRHPVELGEVTQVVVAGEPLVDASLATEDVADPPANLVRVAHDV